MGVQLVIDWKFVAAIGGSVAFIIVATKLDSKAAEKISINTIDTIVEYVGNSYED